jgi:hypothetical protein
MIQRMQRHAALLLVLAPLAFASVAHAQSDTTDPRAHLKAGLYDAGVAAKGMELVAHGNKPDVFHPDTPGGLTYANSDLAFGGHYLYQGNFSGFEIWDIADPAHPVMVHAEPCFTEQGDVSIEGHLLFVSAENGGSRLDCGMQGVQDSVSKDRIVGIRIFDVSDPKNPKQVGDVQTCRGSHTHTLVPDPTDKGVVYVYVSGLARVRANGEMSDCIATGGATDPTSALFRIEIIRVPLAHPGAAKIVSTARVFNDLAAVTSHGLAYADTANGVALRVPRRYLSQVPATATAADSVRIAHLFSTMFLQHGDSLKMAPYADSLRQAGVALQLPPEIYHPTGPSQCHDITVYPAAGLAGGACSGYGLLLNIKDPVHPVRLDAASDSNFAFWHSATFSNDASKMIFTDEWGGGTQAKCRATDPINWGADRLLTIDHGKLTAVGYYKMPAAQGPTENCVAHNGSLVPVPGRFIITQAWYQGGASVVDLTDEHHPKEIAYFDRGPIDAAKLVIGGYWATYYYNGYIYGSEIARGVDVLKLTPTPDLTQNEIDAASLVRFNQFNPQEQPKLVWPAAFPVARAYLDQIVRDNGLPEARTTAIAAALKNAEQVKGAPRTAQLQRLATELDRDAKTATDVPRVQALAKVVRELEVPKA